MDFVKYHGLGNDFIILDQFRGRGDFDRGLVVPLCRRRTGVGADGLILAERPRGEGHAHMVIYNADGSEAEMCGNGIRCLAAYLFTEGLVVENPMLIETGAGNRQVRLLQSGGVVIGAEVEMGLPEFYRPHIPMMGEGVEMVEEPLEVDGTELIATCLSVGNPHCVIFVDRVNEAPVQELGSRIENNPLFPHRTNVEFVETVSRNHLKVRVWERGVGETLACGTGACAAFAAGLRTERTGQEVTVELPGGSLDIRVDDHGHIHMAGTVVEVFRGRLSKAWLERR